MPPKDKTFFFKQLTKHLLVSSAISLTLLFGRMIFVIDWAFYFIIWNLFLAWVPFILAYYLNYFASKKGIYFQTILFIIWLLFLPNAPYLITDFIHLTTWYKLPIWYDIILFTSFAWNGIMLGFVSIFLVENFLKKILTTKKANALINLSLFLSCFGIYFGRYMRHNSWDILAHPILIAGNLANTILDKENALNMIGMTVTWFIFLAGGYRLLRLLLSDRKI